MTDITEIILRKYKKGQLPHEGDVIWSRIMLRSEYDKKKKAILRLVSYIESLDENRCTWRYGNTLTIKREEKAAEFNNVMDVVYERNIDSDQEFHKKAVIRLAKYLSENNEKYNYYGGVNFVEIGVNHYNFGIRNTKFLNDSDKIETIKRKITGRKSALTRSINKAKRKRAQYTNSLFPQDYTSDPSFIKLLLNIKKQRVRIKEARLMSCEDIESCIGDMQSMSRPSFKDLGSKLNCCVLNV